MEKKSGIVIVAKYKNPFEHARLYGREQSLIVENGFQLFSSIAEALPAYNKIICDGVGKLDVAYYATLHMNFLPISRVCNAHNGSYVLLAHSGDGQNYLLGKRSEKHVSIFDPSVSDFELNGLHAIRDFSEASDLTLRLRKRGIQTQLTSFQLKRNKY
jgi:hypothetical protein